jgi:hypothetical protein
LRVQVLENVTLVNGYFLNFQKVVFPLGRDSSVGVVTRYGLDGPRIESRWAARFSAPVQTGPGAHPACYTLSTGSFPAVKRPEHGGDHSPHLATRLKKAYSYTSTPPLGLRSLSQGDLGLDLYCCLYFEGRTVFPDPRSSSLIGLFYT